MDEVLVIDDKQAKLVRGIFGLYLEGKNGDSTGKEDPDECNVFIGR